MSLLTRQVPSGAAAAEGRAYLGNLGPAVATLVAADVAVGTGDVDGHGALVVDGCVGAEGELLAGPDITDGSGRAGDTAHIAAEIQGAEVCS